MAPFDVRRWNRASKHLDDLLDLSAPERDASLAKLRLGNSEVADDVLTLLDAHRRLTAEGFLEADVSIKPLGSPTAGLTVGAYELTTLIGQGGMGSVWLAARSDGRFEGTVAVKLLNTELIGRNGSERFTREGNILARLTHPNIARLLDAGIASNDRPFIVLEYVDGQQIDHYCDEHASPIDQRVELFLDVLAAVAHAHANLIVHRDLKPSNVLVTRAGQVKLLDFGIAKLIERDPTTETVTLLTNGPGALTPKYAAPEQMSGGAITTATDVYALGVVLYELLSGAHPTGDSASSAAGLITSIVDVEPPLMSQAAASKLRQALSGDLDTIVAKALKKAPEERYATAGEFADDLRRYLNHQPIAARPDSFGYISGKFIRRHRAALAAAAVAIVTITVLVGFYTVQLARERDRAELQAAKSQRMSELLTSILRGADPFRTPDGKVMEPTVRSLLDAGAERVKIELNDQPELQADMLSVIGRTYERMALPEKALPLLEASVSVGRRALGNDHEKVAQGLNDLGVLKRFTGDLESSEQMLAESLAIRRRLHRAPHNDVAITLVELSRTIYGRGRIEDVEPLIREALDLRIRVYGHDHRETATSKNELALLLWRRGHLDEAERLQREHYATIDKVLGPEHANAAGARNNLALVLKDKGDLAGAEVMMRESMAIDVKTVGVTHPEYANAMQNLAIIVHDQGRLDEAQSLIDEALRIVRLTFNDEHPLTATYLLGLGRIQIARGDLAKAEATLRKVLPVRVRVYQSTDWRIGQVKALLGGALAKQRKDQEAEPLLVEAAALLKAIPGVQGKDAAFARSELAALKSRKASL